MRASAPTNDSSSATASGACSAMSAVTPSKIVLRRSSGRSRADVRQQPCSTRPDAPAAFVDDPVAARSRSRVDAEDLHGEGRSLPDDSWHGRGRLLETIRRAPKALCTTSSTAASGPRRCELAARSAIASCRRATPRRDWFRRGADCVTRAYLEGFRHTVALMQTKDASGGRRRGRCCRASRSAPRQLPPRSISTGGGRSSRAFAPESALGGGAVRWSPRCCVTAMRQLARRSRSLELPSGLPRRGRGRLRHRGPGGRVPADATLDAFS